MAAKEATERRVYNLPSELVDRIRAFQTSQGIANETEAVRRLLDVALQTRDSIFDLLNKLSEQYKTERDLRALARDVLASHAKVKSVEFHPNSLDFVMIDGAKGSISTTGTPSYFNSDEDEWYQYAPRPSSRSSSTRDEDAPF